MQELQRIMFGTQQPAVFLVSCSELSDPLFHESQTIFAYILELAWNFCLIMIRWVRTWNTIGECADQSTVRDCGSNHVGSTRDTRCFLYFIFIAMTNDIQHVIAGRLYIIPFRFNWHHITSSLTMRISSQCAMVLAVIATLTSSISAVPAEADGEQCPVFCHKYSECTTCPENICVSFFVSWI